MSVRKSREEKDKAILTCQYCKKKEIANGNFYFTTKQQKRYTTYGLIVYYTIECYSRVCISCHKKMTIIYKRRNPELYRQINKRSYDKTNYKGKFSKNESRNKI